MNAYERLNAQPFYVVNDQAYNRMKLKLVNGERFVKTYLTICPHSSTNNCKCPFNINFLKDDEIVRMNNGTLKSVYPLSHFIENTDINC